MVDLIELFSNNSDGTHLTPDQQRSWAAQASIGAVSAPTATSQPHAVAHRLGPDAAADIIRRYAAGETANALADAYGVSRNAVLNLLRANNVVVRRQPPTAEQKGRFIEQYESGATIAEIAQQSGFSFGSVQKVLHAAGIQMRSRGGSAKRR